jgi:hypothetical protein
MMTSFKSSRSVELEAWDVGNATANRHQPTGNNRSSESELGIRFHPTNTLDSKSLAGVIHLEDSENPIVFCFAHLEKLDRARLEL